MGINLISDTPLCKNAILCTNKIVFNLLEIFGWGRILNFFNVVGIDFRIV